MQTVQNVRNVILERYELHISYNLIVLIVPRWVSIWTGIWTRVDEILTRNIYHRVAKVFTKVEINGTLRHKPLLALQVNIRVYRLYQDSYLPSSSVSKLYH